MAFATIDLTKGVTGVLPSANATYSTPRENAKPLIINGDMAIHQRATAGTSNNSFGVDRFKCSDTANFDQRGFTINQDTDVPSGNGFANSLKFTMTTPETTIDADEYGRVETILEGQDVQLLKYGTSSAENVTLSFWVKSNVTGNYAVSLYQDDDTRIIGSTYTVSSSATWEKKVINFNGDTTGVIDNNNGQGLSLRWYMSAGSNFTSSDNTSWGASSDSKLAYGQVASVMSTTSGYWYITGVQLEVGQFTSATLPPFQFESFGDNLARCQRYYYRMINENIAMATFSYYSSNRVEAGISFPVSMRTAPSLVSTSGSGYFRVQRNGGDNNLNDLSANNIGINHASIFNTDEASGNAGDAGYGYSRGSGYLSWNAEL